MLKANAKKVLALLLAALMLAGVVPAAIFSLAADTAEKTVHTDLFVPNVITTKEGSTEVASTTLSDKWDDNLVEQREFRMGTIKGWWGTKTNGAHPHEVDAQAMMGTAGNGYAIFKITAPEGGKVTKLTLTVNARWCGGECVKIAVSDTLNGTYTEVFAATDPTSGHDQDVDISDKVKDAGDVFVKAIFTTGSDWSSLYSLTADTTYAVTAEEEPENTSTLHNNVFVPNVITTEEGKTDVKSTAPAENWKDNVVAEKDMKMGTSKGWWGTATNWCNPNTVDAQAMMGSAENGYAIFKIAAPEGGKVYQMTLNINARWCSNHYVRIGVSDTQDGTYTDVFCSTDPASGHEKNIDVSRYVKGAGDVYVKAVFTASGDWSSLYYLTSDTVYDMGEKTDEPETVKVDTDLFVPNVIESLTENKTATTSLNKNWKQYIVESSNVKMGTSNGWHGTADQDVNPNYTNAQAMFNDDGGSSGYAIFKIAAPKDHKVYKLSLVVNARLCNKAPTVMVGTKKDGEFTDVYTPNGDTAGKDTRVDVTQYTQNKGDIYVKVSFPPVGYIDWASLWAIYANAEYVEGTPEQDTSSTERIAMIDYSKDNWATAYPYESKDGLDQGDWEYATNKFKKGLRRDDTGSHKGDGEIVYKFSVAELSALELRLTHRSCNGAPVRVLYSTDNKTYTELANLIEDHLNTDRPATMMIDQDMFDGATDVYVKLYLDAEGIYIDHNVIDTLTVLAHKGEVKRYFNLTAQGNDGGSVSVPKRVEQGKEVTATATVNEGYTFWGWFNKADGAPLGTDTTLTITPESDLDLVARFQPIYKGDGELVLYTDFNDHQMTYLSQLDDYKHITIGVDDGLRTGGKYGLHIQRADVNTEAYFIYHFQNMTGLNTFKAIPKGRAINGVTITFSYSDDGETWETVKTLGGSIAAMDFGYNDEKQANFTDFVEGKADFYVRVSMSIGGLGDWATLRSLTFVKNGAVLPNDSDVVEIPEGELGNVANKNGSSYIKDGTLLDVKFDADNWAKTVWSNQNGMCGKEGMMVASVANNAEVVWKFDSLKPLESLTLNLKGRAVMGSGILIRYRTNLDDEETWRGAGLLDDDEGIKFSADSPAEIKLAKVKGATTVYVKAIFMTKDSPNRAYISEMKVTAAASAETSEPDSSDKDTSDKDPSDAGSDAEPSTPDASEVSKPDSSKPDTSKPDSPDTGVVFPAMALLLCGGSAAALTVLRKKRHN